MVRAVQLLRPRLQQRFVHGIGDQQPRVVRRDGERLGHLAEPPAGEPVHDAGQQVSLLRGYGSDARFLCHTR